jgi:3-hydroxyacyl-CoA dehydrogenase
MKPKDKETMNRFNVRKVAVLGAGVMGAQIAAHLVNCKVPVVLFDLPAKEGPKNGIVAKAIDNLKKLKPAPLGVADDAALIQPGQLRGAPGAAGGCDLVIEAIAERMDWKLDLYTKIAPHVAPHAIVASNTSGLSITQAERRCCPRRCAALLRHPLLQPAALHALVELIPTPATEPRSWTSWNLRHHARWARAWCAPRTRPTSSPTASASPACWRRCRGREVRPELRRGRRPDRQEAGPRQQRHLPHRRRGGPGHDGHVIKTLQDNLQDDPFYASFATPDDLAKLIAKGALGQKTGAGFYKKAGKDILRFDPATGDYVRPAARPTRSSSAS